MTEEKLYHFIDSSDAEKIVTCTHQTPEGKLTIERLNNNNDVRCTDCGMEFNLNHIDSRKFKEALKVIFTMIQQTRTYLNEEEHSEMNSFLGELDYNSKEVKDLYKYLTQSFKEVR
jgi:hypothetical protein